MKEKLDEIIVFMGKLKSKTFDLLVKDNRI